MTEYIDKGIAINIIEMTDHTGYSLECVTDITDLAVKAIKEMPTADVVEADNVQKTVETYCTDNCYHNAHCMEMYKDVDDAVEYLERKCEKCPLRELRDLDMRGENNELHKRL